MKMQSRLCLLISSVFILLSCSDSQQEKKLTGYVESDYLYIAAPQAGWIHELNVKDGQLIKNQQLLFSLDQDKQQLAVNELQARLEQANDKQQDLLTGARQQEIEKLEAQLKEASANLELAQLEQIRVNKLVAEKLISEEEADKANTQLEKARAAYQQINASIDVAKLAARPAQISAAQKEVAAVQAQLQQAKWQLEQRNVYSEQDAQVVDLLHFSGEFVNVGQPIVVLETASNFKIRFFVSQEKLSQLTPGQTVEVKADGQSKPIEASISYISNQAEYTPPVLYTEGARQKLVFLVEAKPQSMAGLHAGLPVEVGLHE
ncbi:HlyD family secretion protein [Neptunicella marina]|uniref:HlyD family efflux transporter periplasmic adaptor subunit n=1 Tax=Neptunicella marina TaxID=2125989 RepID=A0A8J6IUW3_9ALTE|nr:HlyD family efflux transporter periplasmic adaptor subunit [Neptunicella marina]MBC3767800.1 HlyD family efflux transporter periplasmic adaptor subunit [Neptunicella marina]